MAILQLEDLSGSCEAVVFPKSYARLADHLMTEARLLIWAGGSADDRVQLIIDDCRAIDDLAVVWFSFPLSKPVTSPFSTN